MDDGDAKDNKATRQRATTSPVTVRWTSVEVYNDDGKENAPLLPAGTGTMTTELLRLCPPGVGDEESAVVGNELLLELDGRVGVVVLGEVGDDCLGDCLADGVDLRGVTSTLDADADVDARERLLAGNKDTLVDLEAELLRLEEVDGRAVDADDALALTGVRDRRSSLQNHESALFQ